MDLYKKLLLGILILVAILGTAIIGGLLWWKDYDNRRMVRNYGKTYMNMIKNYGK